MKKEGKETKKRQEPSSHSTVVSIEKRKRNSNSHFTVNVINGFIANSVLRNASLLSAKRQPPLGETPASSRRNASLLSA
jgi:hypothetical protein